MKGEQIVSDTEIKMEKIGKQIEELKREHEKLRSIQIIELQDKIETLVGMSFRDECNNYFRIIGIPHVEYCKSCTSFNEYQIPVLICYNDSTICADAGRIAIDTRFSTASHAEDPIERIRKEYIEVSPEEFDAALEKAFDEIRALGKRGDAKCSGTV